MVSEFYLWWSEQTSVPIIYFLQILRCTLTSYIPTHHQDLHSKSKSQTKNIRTTWNSIDPNGYSMGSKSNMNPNLMKFITQHSSVHVMRKEKARRKSEAACWNYQNLIPHTVPTLHYSSQLIVQKCVTRYQKNKWNHLNIQMSENLTPCSNDSPLYSNILHSFNYTIIINNTFSSKSQQQHFFPFVTFSCSAPSQGLLTMLCNQHGRNLTCSTREASY